MKQFIIKVVGLATLCSILICGYSRLAEISSEKYFGASTEQQIDTSFNNAVTGDYNCYFLGNSRIYRGINPEKLSAVCAYNFAHDNDSYNQMYYKLVYLLEHEKSIEYLIIGTDYFQFSLFSKSRNYAYNKWLSKEYVADYGQYNWITQTEERLFSLWNNKQNALSSCIRFIQGVKEPENKNYQRQNGQYVVYGNANKSETIVRNYDIRDIQYQYFKKIISLCEEWGIKLYIIMPPLREGELVGHSSLERDEFDVMIEKELKNTPYAGNYINYSRENGLLPYTEFIDITHLNPLAANKYSEYLNDVIFLGKLA